MIKLFATFMGGILFLMTAPANALVNGTLVDSNDPIAQTTVGIYIQDANAKTGAICSGTLMSETQVLSAGHCATGGPGTEFFIVFGTDMQKAFKDPMRIRRVTSRRIDPSYVMSSVTGQDHSDISVFTFIGGVPAGLGYHPARLMTRALAQVALKDEGQITLAGYGATDYYAKSPAGVLRKIRTKIDKVFENGRSVKVGTHSHGACHGDSGGPAIVNYLGQNYVFAVTSRATSTSGGECTGRAIYSVIYNRPLP